MPEWQSYWPLVKAQTARIPGIAWAVGGVIAVSLAVVFGLQFSGPPYTALYDGLAPAEGGKVIAQLQKLGIPYQLQQAGNVILVPVPELSKARLELGQAGIPADSATAGWDQLESAPMTSSDLAQNTMATRALEASLAQAINSLEGISGAQVFLATPKDTPFLADQPKASASVIIMADQQAAERQGAAIARLVAGAVTGLSADDVNVATISGMSVYPPDGSLAAGGEFSTVAQVENTATMRIAQLLTALVGAGNFRTDVAANLDFTQTHIHQIAYGPTSLIAHQVSSQSAQPADAGAIGIPGAMANEPPGPTKAAPAAPPANTATGAKAGAGAGNAVAATTAATANAGPPLATSEKSDKSYVTDESESDITKPNWAVKSIAVSVVLNKAAMGQVTTDQVKAAITNAFAYPQVSVNVLAAPFVVADTPSTASRVVAGAGPLTRAVLEVLAAAALLFGFAVPLGRRLATINPQSRAAKLPHRPLPAVLPQPDVSALRDVARSNPAGVARLLQNWADEHE